MSGFTEDSGASEESRFTEDSGDSEESGFTEDSGDSEEPGFTEDSGDSEEPEEDKLVVVVSDVADGFELQLENMHIKKQSKRHTV